jgi:hypothetical protein
MQRFKTCVSFRACLFSLFFPPCFEIHARCRSGAPNLRPKISRHHKDCRSSRSSSMCLLLRSVRWIDGTTSTIFNIYWEFSTKRVVPTSYSMNYQISYFHYIHHFYWMLIITTDYVSLKLIPKQYRSIKFGITNMKYRIAWYWLV